MSYRSFYVGLGAIQPPPYLAKAVALRGGVNPYGEPRYRLVRAEGRFRLSYGTWREFLRGTAIKDRNLRNRAWRAWTGMRLVSMYPGEHGWVLERWRGQQYYGSPLLWYAPEAMGGTMRWCAESKRWMPKLGGYPWRGDYEETTYIFRTCRADTETMDLSAMGGDEAREYIYGELSEALVMTAIGRIEYFREGLPENPTTRVNMAVADEAYREERAGDQYEALAKDILDDVGGISARTPGGWAEIHRDAEAIGIRNHLGG